MPTPDIMRRSLLNAPVRSLAESLRRAEPLGELAKDALLSREQAQAMVEKAVKLSKADAIEVLRRPHAVRRQALLDLVLGFRQMDLHRQAERRGSLGDPAQ